jgi:hypothetical protein
VTPVDQGVSELPQRPHWTALFVAPLIAALTPLDHVLAGMIRAGQGIEALCLYLGLARDALFDRIVELGLITPHDRPMRRPCGKRPWLAADVQLLIRFWVDGVRVVSIAGELERSPGAVSAKARRLGLPKRDRRHLRRLEPGVCRAVTQPPPAPTPAEDEPAPTPAEDEPAPASVEAPVAAVPAAEAPIVVPVAPPALSNATEPAQIAEVPTEAAPIAARAEQIPALAQHSISALVPEWSAAPAAAAKPVQVPQPRRRKGIWTKDLDLEFSMRVWGQQHPDEIAAAMAHHGLTASALASRFTRLQLPRRARTDLVSEFDPVLAERTMKASGYVLRLCPVKNRHFWAPRCGNRISDEGKKSAEYRAKTAGLG